MQDIVNLIDGRWAAPRGARRYQAVNPSDTADVIADYALSSTTDVEDAVAAAQRMQDGPVQDVFERIIRTVIARPARDAP